MTEKQIKTEILARDIFRSVASAVWVEDEDEDAKAHDKISLLSDADLRRIAIYARNAARIYEGVPR